MVRLITEEEQVVGHKAKVGWRRGTGHPPRRGFLYLHLLLLASFFQPFFIARRPSTPGCLRTCCSVLQPFFGVGLTFPFIASLPLDPPY